MEVMSDVISINGRDIEQIEEELTALYKRHAADYTLWKMQLDELAEALAIERDINARCRDEILRLNKLLEEAYDGSGNRILDRDRQAP
jgi:hypothetical protein